MEAFPHLYRCCGGNEENGPTLGRGKERKEEKRPPIIFRQLFFAKVTEERKNWKSYKKKFAHGEKGQKKRNKSFRGSLLHFSSFLEVGEGGGGKGGQRRKEKGRGKSITPVKAKEPLKKSL